MILGFTGTQQGMTESQETTFRVLVAELEGITEFHHGDCVGSDAQAHEIVCEKTTIIIHPPDIPTKRAFCKGEILEEKPYLARNKDIVNASDWLVATPKEDHEVRRSGTWATVRYALKKGVPVAVIWPDGTSRRYF